MNDMQRYFYIFLLGLLPWNDALSQEYYNELQVLLRIDSAACTGDINAYYLLADYLDNGRIIEDHLDEHNFKTPIKHIAMRLIGENSLFLNSEFNFSGDRATPQLLKHFLLSNRERIHFSTLTGTFLITPETGRETQYELLYKSPLEQTHDAEFIRDELKEPYWYPEQADGWMPHFPGYKDRVADQQRFKELLNSKNPEVLREIGGQAYRGRQRWYTHQGHREYYKLTSILTGIELYVPGDNKKMVSDLTGYERDGLYNFMIYWATHYKDYQWSESKNRFINTRETPKPIVPVYGIVGRLMDTSQKTALDAYYNLCERRPEEIKPLMDDIEFFPIPACNIPEFNVAYLKPMGKLARYFKAMGLCFRNEKVEEEYINGLRQTMTLKERYYLENKIAATMTLDEVLAFEFCAVFYDNNRPFSFSAGRILDKFYTRHWQELTHNKRQLAAYLMKSDVFLTFGSGAKRGYMMKFWHCDTAALSMIEIIAKEESNHDIGYMVKEIFGLQKAIEHTDVNKEGCDVFGNGLPEYFEDSARYLSNQIINSKSKFGSERELTWLIGRAEYKDIPRVVKALKGVPDSLFDKTEFLHREFGIWFEGSGDSALDAFMSNYCKMDQYHLYAHYLMETGEDIMDSSGQLDFAKVYNALKYDNAKGFVNSQLSREESVYPIIKLLELHFGTTLGFPGKNYRINLFYSGGLSSTCNCTKKTVKWVAYLRKKHLIPAVDSEPPSFYYPLNREAAEKGVAIDE